MLDTWPSTAESVAHFARGLHARFRYHVHGVVHRLCAGGAEHYVMNVTSGTSAHGREIIEDSTVVQPELRSDGYCLVHANCAVVAPSGAVASKSMLHYLQLFKRRPDTHVVMLWHGAATDALATGRGDPDQVGASERKPLPYPGDHHAALT